MKHIQHYYTRYYNTIIQHMQYDTMPNNNVHSPQYSFKLILRIIGISSISY